ncbi:MAG: asparaginase domain-containing protein [Candidatus Woesearchaeota archaeon]|jgi:L-asparaginase
MQQKILVLIMGGTIDSYFDPITEAVLVNQKSIIENYFDSLNLHIKFEFKTICMKDSRQINDEDRKNLLNHIKGSKNQKILITHGTYTMTDTAKFLEKYIKNTDNKTVILTGSMKPLKGFYDGDAAFNLGFAMATILESKEGIYLAMNGMKFLPNEVFKNLKNGRFEFIKK